MNLKEKLEKGKFILTCELTPPKGININKFVNIAKELKSLVDAINVTDFQSAKMCMSSLGGCVILKNLGIEPVLQLTCRDRNRLALQGELLTAYALGIENLLLLTGDHISTGDHPHAKHVIDLDSAQLIQTVKTLEKGKDLAGKKLKGAPSFLKGAALSPASSPRELHLIKMRKKIEAGAEFFQTQAIYDADILHAFLEEAGKTPPIIAGLLPLKSEKMARYMDQHLPGIRIPPFYFTKLQRAEEQVEEGINIMLEIATNIKHMVSGFHIMAVGMEHKLPHILKQLKEVLKL